MPRKFVSTYLILFLKASKLYSSEIALDTEAERAFRTLEIRFINVKDVKTKMSAGLEFWIDKCNT